MSHATSRRALWLQKIADQIAHTLSERIADGTLTPGQSPGSRDALAAEFVTSPTVIDRVLDQLAEDGLLVEGEGGAFTVARAGPRDKGVALKPGDTVKDVIAILELRLGLETVSAALAAERRDDSQMSDIETAAAAFEAAAKAGTGMGQADIHFHRSIAAASGNTYLVDLLDYLGPLLMPRLRLTLPVSGEGAQDENLTLSIREHHDIMSAISAGNSDEARTAMQRHLVRAIDLVKRAEKDAHR